MHNFPLAFGPAALLGTASTGEKIIASDENPRWQRAVGGIVGSVLIPAAYFADFLVSYFANDSRVFLWPP